ncbi:MAG: 50S ribosomal protein L3 [Elusimicrobia bacterium ADurb.Bin231]|nr:MAG: 50S ribosomal protein L3 [Elusimicrobia bacterium ADurb.Bin231]
MKQILGKKIGMTQIFTAAGEAVPVTIISAGPCVVTQIKTDSTDGYSALQIGFGVKEEKDVNKPLAGHMKKSGIGCFSKLTEFRISDPQKYKLGQEIKCDIFSEGDYVDVSGLSKGHGFAGVMKRHGFGGGPSTHGQSDRQRHPGALGAQRPQRVLKGTRMAGRMGNEKVTVQKLEVAKVIPESNIMLIKGAVPGVKNGLLNIRETIKRIKSKPASAAVSGKKGGAKKGAKK